MAGLRRREIDTLEWNEERYQTAAGIERDLRRCLEMWEPSGQIARFPVGLQDVPDQLLVSEKLYGRDSEVDTLLAAFDRVALCCDSEWGSCAKCVASSDLLQMVPNDRLRDQFWNDSNEVLKVSSLRMLVMRFFTYPAFEDKKLVGTSFHLMKFE